MKFTTLIPTRLNDGRKVPVSKLKEFIDGLAVEFGGCSDEGLTKGQWIDPYEVTYE